MHPWETLGQEKLQGERAGIWAGWGYIAGIPLNGEES